jgi:DNA polymerase-1
MIECKVCYEPLDDESETCRTCLAEDVAAGVAEPVGTIVFDLETASADELHDSPDARKFVRIAGYTFGETVADTESVDEIIDLVSSSAHVVGTNLIHFDLPALQRVNPDKIDILTMARDGRIFDTMVAESVLFPVVSDLRSQAIGRAAKHFSLASSCERWGVEGKTDNAKALAKEYGGYDQVPVDVLRPYVHGDVAATNRLKSELVHKLLLKAPRPLQTYLAREHRVHAIASQMSISGFQADELELEKRYKAAEARKLELRDQLCAKYDIPTVTSTGAPAKSVVATKDGKEAIVAAFVKMGVREDDIPRTEKGTPSFGGDNVTALAKLYEHDPNGEEIESMCEIIGDTWGVRAVYKTAATYLKRDGRVHPQVATFQASGRWSVTKPGLTVFGKRGLSRDGQPRVNERAVFQAGEGNVLMAIDLSQVDSRAIAVHSQDEAYMALFLPGLDAHELVARMVWGDTAYDSNSKMYRDKVKQITHGVPYGMGVPKLALNAGVPESEAQRVVDTMNERFPRLQVWKNEVREKAGSGEWLDNGFGRQMRPDKSRAYTQGPALMGQGCARDLMMECLIRVDNLDDKRIIKMLRAQIHDEAIFEFPEVEKVDLRRQVEECFNFPWAPVNEPSFKPIQLVAEGGPFGKLWSQCY